MTADFLPRMRQLAASCREALDTSDEARARQTFHSELSPLAWHVGHAFYTEALWLGETVHGDDALTAAWRPLFAAELSDKASRGHRLPDKASLLAWCDEVGTRCDKWWDRLPANSHPLLRDDYLGWFLLQHYAQHLETLRLVLRQQQLSEPISNGACTLHSVNAATQALSVSRCEVRIGSDDEIRAYDNELRPQMQSLDAFRIALRPVTNGEWLAFMGRGGHAPDGWRLNGGDWHLLDDDGTRPLADQPVCGISHREAQAYADWAGARLPHEYEWEAAARAGILEDTGIVWEWCSNALHPYPGFKPHPYEGYSVPWFDGRHFVLRGGSRFTEPEIKRASFRNFYPPTHRHVCAGLRLAWS